MSLRALVCGLAALVLVAPAAASEQRPTLAELESETVCPVCGTTVDQSTAPVAERMRAFMRARVAAGDTKSEIKRKLVAEFGPEIVETAPPRRGFDWLAWLLPSTVVLAAGALLAFAVVRWTRTRDRADSPPPEADPERNGRVQLDPELERRVDEELARFEA